MKCLSEPELDGLVCMWTALGRQCAGKFIKKKKKKRGLQVNNL